MKIKTIMCNCSPEFFAAHSGIRRDMATKEVELLVANIDKGPLSLESSVDAAFAAPYIMKEVASAQDEGCEAVVIDCSVDPMLRAAREISKIPVVSAGESSHHAAMMLCDKFSIITVLPISARMIRENIQKYGYVSRVASVRAANVPVLELEDQEKAFQGIRKAAERAISEDGAEAIVLGCTGMMATQKRLQNHLGIPVIEPLTMGIQYAAAMVRAGLCQSRVTYEAPSPTAVTLLKEL